MGMERIKMNKKGLEFKLAFFALISFSMIIIAVGVILSSWNVTYDSGITTDIDELNALNALDASTDEARSQQAGINPESQSTEPGSRFEDRTFRGGFGIINSIFGAFNIVLGENGMIAAISQQFGIPNYIWQGILTMMTIAITMGIIAILFRLNRRTA